MAENKDRRCKKCGGLDEFVYEVNWVPVYYCGYCDLQTKDPKKELVGRDDRLIEEAGE